MINNTLEIFYTTCQSKAFLFLEISTSEDDNITVSDILFEENMVFFFRVWATNIVGAVSTDNITVCEYRLNMIFVHTQKQSS